MWLFCLHWPLYVIGRQRYVPLSFSLAWHVLDRKLSSCVDQCPQIFQRVNRKTSSCCDFHSTTEITESGPLNVIFLALFSNARSIMCYCHNKLSWLSWNAVEISLESLLVQVQNQATYLPPGNQTFHCASTEAWLTIREISSWTWLTHVCWWEIWAHADFGILKQEKISIPWRYLGILLIRFMAYFSNAFFMWLKMEPKVWWWNFLNPIQNDWMQSLCRFKFQTLFWL